MLSYNYRTMVASFSPLPGMVTNPYVAKLTEERPPESFIKINTVPGIGNSSIEKMTHPLAEFSEMERISPYMMHLLGDQTALEFANHVLQAKRKHRLDELGIDDKRTNDHTQQRIEMEIITRFYPRDTQTYLKKIELNDQPFIEQEPTKPYFFGQKVITPDFTLHRTDQERQRKNLLLCRTRDDNLLYFNQAPITELQKHNNEVFIKELIMRSDGSFQNKTQYFHAMIDYLTNFGQPGDILVQNSLEVSTDMNTPHLQFIPGDVPLPLFSQPSQPFADSGHQYIDWYLPTLVITVDSRQPNWQTQVEQIQTICQQLLENQHISTTPLLRYLGDAQTAMFLIFKQNCNHMNPKDVLEQAPGWLESSGIFIANSSKAEILTRKGAELYYSEYAADRDQLFSTLRQTALFA